MVGEARKRLAESASQPAKRTGLDRRTINTKNIGKARPAARTTSEAGAAPAEVPPTCEAIAKGQESKKPGQDGKEQPPAPAFAPSPEQAPERELAATAALGCFDAEGHMVPEDLRGVFDCCRKFADIDALVKHLQTRIDALADLPGGKLLKNNLRPEPNPDGSKSYCFGGLEEFKNRLKYDRPHAVCPGCSGNRTATCNACEGKGWLPIKDWQNAKLTREKPNQAGPPAD